MNQRARGALNDLGFRTKTKEVVPKPHGLRHTDPQVSACLLLGRGRLAIRNHALLRSPQIPEAQLSIRKRPEHSPLRVTSGPSPLRESRQQRGPHQRLPAVRRPGPSTGQSRMLTTVRREPSCPGRHPLFACAGSRSPGARLDHYPQWLTYPTVRGLPREGSRVGLSELPEHSFVATAVESGSESAIVWLKPLRGLDSF